MATKIVPDPSAALVSGEGARVTEQWYAFFRRVGRALVEVEGTASGLASSKASVTQTWAEGVYIELADDKAYPFIDLAIAGTIDEVVTLAQSGTCTVTVSINGVALGGPANAGSTTRVTHLHTVSNALTDGDDVTITVSSNSSCEGLSVTLRGSRTLA